MSGVTECSHVETRGHPVLKAASLVIRAKTRSPTCLQTSFSHFSRVQVPDWEENRTQGDAFFQG